MSKNKITEMSMVLVALMLIPVLTRADQKKNNPPPPPKPAPAARPAPAPRPVQPAARPVQQPSRMQPGNTGVRPAGGAGTNPNIRPGVANPNVRPGVGNPNVRPGVANTNVRPGWAIHRVGMPEPQPLRALSRPVVEATWKSAATTSPRTSLEGKARKRGSAAEDK